MRSTSAAITTYCRQCGYALVGLSENRCPECGRRFDPGKPTTYGRSAHAWWVRKWSRQVVLVASCLVGMCGLTTGTVLASLYWGWKAEQPVIAALRQTGCIVEVSPLPARWHQALYTTVFDNGLPPHESGWAGTYFVRLTERVTGIEYSDGSVRPAEVAGLAKLGWLQRVTCVRPGGG